MPSGLVTVEELADWLGQDITETENLLGPLIDQVEALFLAECTRRVPFQAAQPGRIEVIDGTFGVEIYLDYPIGVLNSVILGTDYLVPDETLDVTDRTIVVWSLGKRRIVRVDGGNFGGLRPEYVRVTYDAGADLPLDAARAVKHMAAGIYMQRGAEDVKSERVASYSSDLASLREADVWKLAIAAHREFNL